MKKKKSVSRMVKRLIAYCRCLEYYRKRVRLAEHEIGGHLEAC